MSEKRVEVSCPFCGHKQWVNLDELDEEWPAVYRGAPAAAEYRVQCAECGRRFVSTVPGKGSNDE